MPNITEKEVEHIAELARIRLTEKEKRKFTEDLGNILNFVDKLNEVDTEGVGPVRSRPPRVGRSHAFGGAASNGVEPVSNITGLDSVFRKDEVRTEVDPEKSKRLVEQAPDRKDNYVKVKSVFREE